MRTLATPDNRIGLIDGSASLAWREFTEWTYILALIANTMRWLDIALGVRAISGQWNHVVKDKSGRPIFEIGVNRLITDIAMVAIALNNATKIHFLNLGGDHLRTTTTEDTHKNQAISRFFALCTTICSVAILIGLIVGAVVFSFASQNVLSILFSASVLVGLLAMLTSWVVPIPFGLVWPEFTQGLLRTACVTPLVPISNNDATPIANFAYMLAPRRAIFAFLAVVVVPIIVSSNAIKAPMWLFFLAGSTYLVSLTNNRKRVFRSIYLNGGTILRILLLVYPLLIGLTIGSFALTLFFGIVQSVFAIGGMLALSLLGLLRGEFNLLFQIFRRVQDSPAFSLSLMCTSLAHRGSAIWLGFVSVKFLYGFFCRGITVLTNFGKHKQRGLNKALITMIQCAHSYGLLLDYSLDSKGATNTLAIKRISSIIPQNSSTGYFTPLCSEQGVL